MFLERLRRLVAGIPLRLGRLHVAVLILQLPVLVWDTDWSGKHGLAWLATVPLLGLGWLLTVILPIQILAVVGARHRWLRLTGAAVLVALHSICIAYRLRNHGTFDWRALTANFQITGEAVGVGIGAVNGWILLCGLALLVALVGSEIRGRPIVHVQPRRWLQLGGGLVIYGSFIIVPLAPADEFSRALRAPIDGYRQKRRRTVVLAKDTYPLVHTLRGTSSPPERLPDVFLIIVESFRASHVGKSAPNGRPYTPYLNQLIGSGLYVERFYANSVQTRKGQFATLCSVIPAIDGNEFTTFGANRYDCLPRKLQRRGYHTTFFQAYPLLSFDNTGEFMSRQGFDEVETVERSSRPEDRFFRFGWGIEDSRFYQRFFERLDGQSAETVARPQFVTLVPIISHMWFDKVPGHRQFIHRPPRTLSERYANTIHLADLGLREFFVQLQRRPRFRNAIVVITGDHGFPLGEHGLEINTEDGGFEEFFRVPLFVHWPDGVKPERVLDAPYSQLDIAPTILDLIGGNDGPSHFMGISLMQQPRPHRAIPLVQPYAGGTVGVVDLPYKYLLHLASNKAQLFDLLADPMEKHDLARSPDFDDKRATLHHLLAPIFVVQAALEGNQVWP